MARRSDTRLDEYEQREYYRERDSARPAPVVERERPLRGRDLEELYARRGDNRDREVAFLREDYTKVEEQPLVLRGKKVETFIRPIHRSPPRSQSPSIERERVRTRVVERERERDRSPSVERERVRTRVVERGRERSPSPIRERSRVRIVERARERSPEPEIYRTRYVERERDVSPAHSEVRTSIVRAERRSPSGDRERTRTTTRIVEKVRSRSRSRSPSPLYDRERISTRVVERERHRSPSSSPESLVRVPVEPPVVRAPPIHQEIITHHRHIDHGFEYAPPMVAVPAPRPVPTPRPRSPLPPPPRRERETEIDIYTGRNETEVDIVKSTRNKEEKPRERREFYDDDVLYERDRERERLRARTNIQRSSSARRDRGMGRDESEGDYYARKTAERAYIGEAWNGATKKWEIVDVPPGTERVRMDGVGGGSQEITWQKYNGVRRSKFIPERDTQANYERDYERDGVRDTRISISRPLPPPRNRNGGMWTEITKDLVVREAIEELGYDYEETEYFFYVIQYLQYEDVLELVELSRDIVRDRRHRIRDMAREREDLERGDYLTVKTHHERFVEPAYDDERIVEREIIYDAPRRSSRVYY